ncbi:MAG: Mut7-C RNAse domain-containing protein [Propionivibrio sp.]
MADMTEFRFYAELNDFLPLSRRGRDFEHAVSQHQTLKHVVESFGVPHTEVGLSLVNSEAAQMDCRLGPNDRVSVLPAFRSLRDPRSGEPPRFIADAHLGRLARYLRFAGFDTLWRNAWSDAELVAMAARDNRIVLTRDRDLLMHKALSAGCYVRDHEAMAQLADIARRYALDLSSTGAGRCLECNALPQSVSKGEVAAELLPGTRAAFEEFWRCPGCLRVYWRGSHWRRMKLAISRLSA